MMEQDPTLAPFAVLAFDILGKKDDLPAFTDGGIVLRIGCGSDQRQSGCPIGGATAIKRPPAGVGGP